MLAAAQVVAAVAALLTPAAPGRVYTSRAWPLAQLPAWRVTAATETVEMLTIGSGVQEHTLLIQASCYVRAVDQLDDVMHEHAAAALALLFADDPPYGLELKRIGREMQDGAEYAVGVITLDLQAYFDTAPGAPETII